MHSSIDWPVCMIIRQIWELRTGIIQDKGRGKFKIQTEACKFL